MPAEFQEAIVRAIEQSDSAELIAALRGLVDRRDEDGMTPLMHAARRGFEDGVRLLLAAQADATARCADGLSVLGHALCCETEDLACADFADNAQVVRLLLEAGADPNDKCTGLSALSQAASQGQTECVAALLDSGAVIDVRNEDGETPLSYAVVADHRRVIDVLLARGAEVNTWDNAAGTPLLYSVTQETERPQVVQQLLSYGANPDASGLGGYTPLLAATEHEFWHSAAMLMVRVEAPLMSLPDGRNILTMTGVASFEEYKSSVLERAQETPPSDDE